MDKLLDLRKKRLVLTNEFTELSVADEMTPEQDTRFKALETEISGVDAQIERVAKAQAAAAKSAVPVAGQDAPAATTHASAEIDVYVKQKSLALGGIVKMIGKSGGNIRQAAVEAKDLYGENHPVTRALNVSTGASGGFIVPPDFMTEIIELLRPLAVVRAAGPRVIAMPRGTMTLPGQASAASATYSGEQTPIGVSQQTLNQIVASYKKMTALVPVSNDMMRYADPAVDAFVRDDLVKIIALREDLAFLTGDGMVFGPRGMTSFAGSFAISGNGTTVPGGGTAATLQTGANSLFGTLGNYVTSNPSYTLSTAAAELGGLVNKLDSADVTELKRRWFMHPRSFNYLNNVQNGLGNYVYRDELSKGTLLGYPFSKTTQIPNNLWDQTGTQQDLSFIILTEMIDAMILDSMQLELAVSREGTYIDANGLTQSAFTNDQTIIRAIAEHDFQMRQPAAVAVLQGVRWAPAIS